ncbi:MAG: hypothetical protein EPN47_07400 [Acidobacteria bacterium]|nr:MAG: hypothetical protein EPN47_07400 [Acidobacteriota bacterium]
MPRQAEKVRWNSDLAKESMETPMRKVSRRLWFAPGLLALGMCACAVFYVSNSEKVRFVIITPGNPVIVIGGVQQFALNVTFVDGVVTQPDPTSGVWTSSNSSVAVVNSQGQATGVKAGTAVITGTYKGVSGSTVLAVNAASSVNFRVSGSASTLKVSFLKTGRNFSYVLNPADDTIAVYGSGGLQGQDRLESVVSVAPGHSPGWLAIGPSGRFLYVANHGSANISVFVIDPATGRLGSVPGSPFDVGGGVWAVAVESSGRMLSVMDFNASSAKEFQVEAASGAVELWR